MTDASAWPRIEALFDQAMDIPAPQRQAWLQASGTPEAIRREVERLLAAAAAADTGWLESDRREAPAPEPALQPGDIAGAWRVVRPLGRGGMGEVHEVGVQSVTSRMRAVSSSE